jgi:8-oxo-dGTP diphosphatase
MKEYVAGFFFDDHAEKVALILKSKPEWQAGNFNAIGGKIEPGETPLDAMIRECEEEAGVTAEWHYRFTYQMENEFAVHFFTTFSSEQMDLIQSMEEEEISFFNPMALPTNVVYNLRWIIPMLLDEEVVIPNTLLCEAEQ